MATNAQLQAVEDSIEELLDRHDAVIVLDSLIAVCFGKAEHLRSNWQDEGSAKAWERLGKALDKAHVYASNIY